VEFWGYTSFRGATFKRHAQFNRAFFQAECSFARATFSSDADFEQSAFFGNCNFSGAQFLGWAHFTNTAFYASAAFDGCRSESFFDLSDAKFVRAPDFSHANLHVPPKLDRVWFRRPFLGTTEDGDASAKFRELRAFASACGNHNQELDFFAEEVRQARFHQDWPWCTRFWLGVLYELLSDFGRSVLRPSLIWLASVLILRAFILPTILIFFRLTIGPATRKHLDGPRRWRQSRRLVL
jgi:hypothetical protein